jgi:hypothetical protein
MPAYLPSLCCTAASAADAAQTDDMAAKEAATVSVTDTSQVVLRSSRHGIKVRPSRRFPV